MPNSAEELEDAPTVPAVQAVAPGIVLPDVKRIEDVEDVAAVEAPL